MDIQSRSSIFFIENSSNLISQEALFLVQNAPKPVSQPGSARTRWGSLQRSPRPPSWIWGRGGEREKGGGRGREEGGGKRGSGKGGKYFGPSSSEKLAPPLLSGMHLGQHCSQLTALFYVVQSVC